MVPDQTMEVGSQETECILELFADLHGLFLGGSISRDDVSSEDHVVERRKIDDMADQSR